MNIDKLVELLNKKISLLNKQKENEDKKMKEVKMLQKVIKTIKKDPFTLYSLDIKEMKFIVNSLSLESDYLEKLEKYRTIYNGYLQFGREAIPQISIVEDFVEDTKRMLQDRSHDLLDVVSEHQYTVLQHQEYSKFLDEINNPDQYVTKIDLLINLLNESDLKEKEKNNIKLAIISKNNLVYQRLKPIDNDVEVQYQDEFEEEIESITQKLEESFKPDTLNQLKTISNLLSFCKTKEDMESILNDWKYQWGDVSYKKVLDALIDLENIEILTLKSIVGQETEKYREDMEIVYAQRNLLEEYKNSIDSIDELEDAALPVEINPNATKFEQALAEYEEDPLATKNCVLYISDGLDRDIKSINDKETLEDVFLLVEQLRKDQVESRKRFTDNKNLTDLEILKPRSKGRQARVIYTRLSDNVYGIISIHSKKADNPKTMITTLETRRKNCNIEELRESINDYDTLTYYTEKTKNISNRLISKLGTNSVEKENIVVGGQK